jgi:hypothetical protein
MAELFDLHASFFEAERFLRLVSRLGLNLVFTAIVVFLVYARRNGRNEYLFTYVMFNLITFTLCFLLSSAPIELGFALGLFAVFGILRYRTEPIRILDLTYLFVVIGLGIMNAVVANSVTLAELLFVNAIITGVCAVLEYLPWLSGTACLSVVYDDMDMVRAGDSDALLTDLTDRTGLKIERLSIESIDLLRETARINIYYRR